jgi:hypothetical protein
MRAMLKLCSDHIWPTILIAGLCAYTLAIIIAVGLYG